MTELLRVREIFEQVVDLPQGERDRRLEALCSDAPELRVQVETLLARDAAAAKAEIEDVPDLRPEAVEATRVRRVGAYEIVRVLGTGGMGTVFEARQERPRRAVALKVLRALVGSDDARRRLEYEAETLGRLRHPGVAQIYESGTWRDPDTGADAPFFAMEFVDGARPIDGFADATQLELRERIELFLAVCDAVQHGHQVGVLHRDIKPANLLVDRAGHVKVIDFGIARATDAADDGRPLQTLPGQVMGTPGYMSPEQLDGNPSRIDVRADVYALGATLYQLLVGTAPHDRRTDSLPEFIARVRHERPMRPSHHAGSNVPAELDWVVLRALAPDPEDRYPSVAELAADLRRFLADQPLVARPPTGGYLLRKFVRRHRLPVAAAAAVLLAMVAGTIAAAVGWRHAVAAEAVAEDRRAQAEQLYDELWHVTQLQSRIFRGARGERDARLVDVIDRAREQLGRERPTSPTVVMALHDGLAVAYLQLGLLDRAEASFAEALRLVEHDSVGTLRLGLQVRQHYASLLQLRGELDEAEELLRAVLREAAAHYGDQNPQPAVVKADLANVLVERGSYPEAVVLYRAALRDYGDAGYDRTMPMVGLAMALSELGESDEAGPLFERVCAIRERTLGPRDPDTLSVRNAYAVFLMDTERYTEAEAALTELWPLLSEVFGPAHPKTTRVASNLGLVAERRERFAEAESIYRRILDTRQEAGRSLEMVDLITRFNLCVALHRQDELEKALAELDALLRDASAMLPADNWRLAVFRQHRGMVLRRSKRFEEAERELARARTVLEQRLGPTHDRTRSNWRETAQLYEDWGRPDEAAKWLDKLGGG